jgi:integrase
LLLYRHGRDDFRDGTASCSMKITRSITKSTKYLLKNYNGIEISLTVPNQQSKEQRYYLDYKNTQQTKYYGNGSVRRRAIEFFNNLSTDKVSHAETASFFAELFKQDIEIIIHELHIVPKSNAISMKSPVKSIIEAFYAYKTLQSLEGTIEKRALCNYGQYHRKLLRYFEFEPQSRYVLADLSAEFWLNYRVALLSNERGMNTKSLCNASINQHFQYITQLYSWLIDYNELPIRNHLKKVKRLNEAKQIKRFKVLSKKLLNEFYTILESTEKVRYTSLYLAALLLYENNIRLSEQVLIQVQDIDFSQDRISVINKKNDSVRTVMMSSKVRELIGIIKLNTVRRGVLIIPELYLFGGYNAFKRGKPVTFKELGTMMRRFRKVYPQFAGRTLYEHKHTSITNQFDAGVDHHSIKERANHSSITTTEIYFQANKAVVPYELRLDDI